MRRLVLPLCGLALLACGSHGDDPPLTSCGDQLIVPPADTPFPPEGTASGSVFGTFATNLQGHATTYQTGSASAAFTIVDGYNVDAQDRPTGELFVLLRGSAKLSQSDLVPVTLADLKNPEFIPTGTIAAYAEAYDSAAGDYTRWLVGKSGCVRISTVTAGSPGKLKGVAVIVGEWRNNNGTLLGQGSASVVIESPLLDLRSGTGLVDAMNATVAGVRAKAFTTSTLDAYQLLHPWQTRLVIVGIQAADTTREMWLSLAGVPQTGDSIALEAVTLAEAIAGRTQPTRSFGMIRMLEYAGSQPVVREIWRSGTGWVKFASVVQNGALALCGGVSGTFSLSTSGASLASPTTDLGTTTVTSGSFSSRMTIVSQSDTLVDPARTNAPVFRLRSPTSTMGFRCQ